MTTHIVEVLPVATNGNMDTMTRSMGELSEAVADNLAAFQQRNVEFARGGLEFLRLQESNARAAQEWWTSGVRLLQLQQRNVSFAQNWLLSGIGLLRDQTEQNRRTAEVFARSAREQQEGLRSLAEGWAGAYQGFFFSPFDYAQDALRAAEQATQQGLQATRQATQQGLQLAVEASEQTEQVVQQAEQVVEQAQQAIRETEIQAAVLRALGTEDYDELTVADVSKKLDDLSVEDLEKLRVYEKRNKNRETLVEQIDRKIRASS